MSRSRAAIASAVLCTRASAAPRTLASCALRALASSALPALASASLVSLSACAHIGMQPRPLPLHRGEIATTSGLRYEDLFLGQGFEYSSLHELPVFLEDWRIIRPCKRQIGEDQINSIFDLESELREVTATQTVQDGASPKSVRELAL